ncbi:MAG: M56 family metallopeptidase [Chloroflexia bacterium]
MAHQAEMPMSGGFWDIIVACLSQPSMVPWPVLILVYVPALLLFSAIFFGLWTLVRQWMRTHRAISKLRSLSAYLEYEMPSATRELLIKLHLQGKVDIIYASQHVAFCYGWLRPRICVSTCAMEDLTNAEIEAVLLHEEYHMHHHDPLKSTLCLVLARLFFLLPVVRALQEQYLVSREIEADRYVLSHQAASKPLLGALYKFIVRSPGYTQYPGYPECPTSAASQMGVAMYSDCISERLDYLLSGNSPCGISSHSLWYTSLVLATVALLGGIGTWNSAVTALWHQVYCTLGTCPLMQLMN